MPGDERNDWVCTYTGRHVYPLAMQAEDIDICDIAHALAMKCRYTGHCRYFMSVAQHSVLMAQFDLPGTKTWRLLHDAAEAYLPDIASPIKHEFPLIVEAEKRILLAVQERFGLPDYDYVAVHKADIAMCIWEGRRLFEYDPAPLWWRKPDPMPTKTWRSWDPEEAEERFLNDAWGLGLA
ncbi:MAG: phosphohydrolase [Bryobacteraceae bacterium]